MVTNHNHWGNGLGSSEPMPDVWALGYLTGLVQPLVLVNTGSGPTNYNTDTAEPLPPAPHRRLQHGCVHSRLAGIILLEITSNHCCARHIHKGIMLQTTLLWLPLSSLFVKIYQKTAGQWLDQKNHSSQLAWVHLVFWEKETMHQTAWWYTRLVSSASNSLFCHCASCCFLHI